MDGCRPSINGILVPDKLVTLQQYSLPAISNLSHLRIMAFFGCILEHTLLFCTPQVVAYWRVFFQVPVVGNPASASLQSNIRFWAA